MSQRKTKFQLAKELETIERLLSRGLTDSMIMTQLNLKRSTYFYYKHKIYDASSEIQKQKSVKVLAFEQQQLKDRLSTCYRLMEEAAADEETRPADKALCISLAHPIAIDILKLEVEGLRLTSEANYVIQKAIEQKAEAERNHLPQPKSIDEQQQQPQPQQQSTATTTATEQQPSTTTTTAAAEEQHKQE